MCGKDLLLLFYKWTNKHREMKQLSEVYGRDGIRNQAAWLQSPLP